MKTLSFALFLVAATTFVTKAQTIEGNGSLKTETRQVSEFAAVSMNDFFEVEITQGNTDAVTVEADENLLPYIETTVDKNELSIRTKAHHNLESKNKVTVRITMSKLTALSLLGSGHIRTSGNFGGDAVNLAISGSGNIKFGFDKIKNLSVAINGSGDANLEGNTIDNLNVSIAGSGDVHGYNATTDNATVSIAGSGDVEVNANKTISATIAGSGDVMYKGSPKVTEQNAGSGKVKKA